MVGGVGVRAGLGAHRARPRRGAARGMGAPLSWTRVGTGTPRGAGARALRR